MNREQVMLTLTLEDKLALKHVSDGAIAFGPFTRFVYWKHGVDGQIDGGTQRVVDRFKSLDLDTIAPSLADKIRDFIAAVEA